jgi:CubicO group peptidase (beta-lactamase class C family)
MNLQFVLEAVTGTLLDQLIHDKFTGPLGMKDSWFNRGNKALPQGLLKRVAATEFQIEVLGPTEPQRPQPVWGNVSILTNWWMTLAYGPNSHRYMMRMRGALTA